MAENHTGWVARRNGAIRDVARLRTERLDDALTAALGRRIARRPRPRQELESGHHAAELRSSARVIV
jgi:hypothetical protein